MYGYSWTDTSFTQKANEEIGYTGLHLKWVLIGINVNKIGYNEYYLWETHYMNSGDIQTRFWGMMFALSQDVSNIFDQHLDKSFQQRFQINFSLITQNKRHSKQYMYPRITPPIYT